MKRVGRVAIYISAIVIGALVWGASKRLLPEYTFNIPSSVFYGPTLGFIILLGLYPITPLGKPFRRHLLRSLIGLGIGIVFLLAGYVTWVALS